MMERKEETPRVVAVVVTYNRKELLAQCIEALRRNRPHAIVVVDNGATDGTHEWLDQQPGLHVVHQANVGGAGGFHRGIQEAYDMGAEWIWCMDDDVRPHDDCLQRLMEQARRPRLGIMSPRRLMQGQTFTTEFYRFNLTNPLRSLHLQPLRGKRPDGPTTIAGAAFEGLCISRSVVEQVGLPNPQFFIFCDDTDYCLRTRLAGFDILYVPDALMDKEKFFSNDSWAQKQEKKKWKRPYQIRNTAYLNHHYGRNWAVRYVRSFNSLLGFLLTAAATAPAGYGYHWRDIPCLIRAYRDGINEKLGIYKK